MGKNTEVSVRYRTTTHKGEVARSRVNGNVPAILYGSSLSENSLLYFSASEIRRALINAGRIGVLSLISEEKDLNGIDIIVKDVQKHPVTDKIVHLDMQLLVKGEKIKVTVPVEFVGTSPAIKAGEVVDKKGKEVDIECLPKDIPSSFSLDISNLNIGDTLHISDLEVSKEINILDGEQISLVSASYIKSIEEETETDDIETEVATGTEEVAEKEETESTTETKSE